MQNTDVEADIAADSPWWRHTTATIRRHGESRRQCEATTGFDTRAGLDDVPPADVRGERLAAHPAP